MRSLGPDRGVVAVAGIHHSRIVVRAEHAARDVAEEHLELAWLPGLAHPAGEQAVAGDRVAGERPLQVNCAGTVTVGEVEGLLSIRTEVPVGSCALRFSS